MKPEEKSQLPRRRRAQSFSIASCRAALLELLEIAMDAERSCYEVKSLALKGTKLLGYTFKV